MKTGAFRALMVLLVALVPSALPAAAAEPAPTKATMAPAEQSYRSPFAGYRRYADQPVESWISANDVVGRIGGWKAYASEAQAAAQPAPPASPSPTKPTTPDATPSGHSTHH